MAKHDPDHQWKYGKRERPPPNYRRYSLSLNAAGSRENIPQGYGENDQVEGDGEHGGRITVHTRFFLIKKEGVYYTPPPAR